MATWQCPNCKREFNNTNQHHFCGNIDSIDGYISQQHEDVQPLLQTIRKVIAAAAPDAEERISWKMPTFWQEEILVHFAAFKKHISIFPGAEATAFFADKLKDYKTNKGTIQFPLDRAIPYELIEEIVRYRVASLESGEQKSKSKSKSKSNPKNNSISSLKSNPKNKTEGNSKQSAKSTSTESSLKSNAKSNEDMDSSKMTREIHDIPEYVITALDESDLWDSYNLRPPYQRNDYIGWISNAKREDTRMKRLSQMLEELRSGDSYMGMVYNARK